MSQRIIEKELPNVFGITDVILVVGTLQIYRKENLKEG